MVLTKLDFHHANQFDQAEFKRIVNEFKASWSRVY